MAGKVYILVYEMALDGVNFIRSKTYFIIQTRRSLTYYSFLKY